MHAHLSLHTHAAVRLLDHADVIAAVACRAHRPESKVSKWGEARNHLAFHSSFTDSSTVASCCRLSFCSVLPTQSLCNRLWGQLLRLQAEELRVRGTGRLAEGPGR